MKVRMYAVFDKAISAFNSPFTARTDGEAKRSFASAVADERGQIGRHRADFSLFVVGEYDDSLGAVAAWPPQCMAEAVSVLVECETFDPIPDKGH